MRSKGSFSSAVFSVLVFFVVISPSAKAGLVYENINGASLIYDSVTNTTWTQNADISGQTFTQSGAEAWAASLNVAGLPTYRWRLPSATEFTSMFTQLDPVGPPGTESNKYGAVVSFGAGSNDYAANVRTEYWTDSLGTDFNFYYGYPGGQPVTNLYAAWAVASPEPSSIVLVVLGIGGVGAVRLARSKKARSAVG